MLNISWFPPTQIHLKIGFTGLQKGFEMLISQELRFVMIIYSNKLRLTVLKRAVN